MIGENEVDWTRKSEIRTRMVMARGIVCTFPIWLPWVLCWGTTSTVPLSRVTIGKHCPIMLSYCQECSHFIYMNIWLGKIKLTEPGSRKLEGEKSWPEYALLWSDHPGAFKETTFVYNSAEFSAEVPRPQGCSRQTFFAHCCHPTAKTVHILLLGCKVTKCEHSWLYDGNIECSHFVTLPQTDKMWTFLAVWWQHWPGAIKGWGNVEWTSGVMRQRGQGQYRDGATSRHVPLWYQMISLDGVIVKGKAG